MEERWYIMEEKRRVVEYIFHSEKRHLRMVRALTRKFPDHLRSSGYSEKEVKGELDPYKVIPSLLGNFEKIHKKIHRDLKQKLESWSETTVISDVFTHYCRYLKKFGDNYASKVNEVMGQIDYLKDKHPQFRSALESFQKSKKGKDFGVGVEDCVVAPLRRLAEYPQLIHEYLTACDPETFGAADSLRIADYNAALGALEVFQSIELRTEDVEIEEDDIENAAAKEGSLSHFF